MSNSWMVNSYRQYQALLEELLPLSLYSVESAMVSHPHLYPTQESFVWVEGRWDWTGVM